MQHKRKRMHKLTRGYSVSPSRSKGYRNSVSSEMKIRPWASAAAWPRQALLNPPAIYEIREFSMGVMLDAYEFGTFGAHLRGDEERISQRWFFEPVPRRTPGRVEDR